MPMTIVMSGIAKMFVGELVEMGKKLKCQLYIMSFFNWSYFLILSLSYVFKTDENIQFSLVLLQEE